MTEAQTTKGRAFAAAISHYIAAQDYRYADRPRQVEKTFEQLVKVIDDALRVDGAAT